MWPGPLGHGLLGPRPGTAPFAGAAMAGPPPDFPPQQQAFGGFGGPGLGGYGLGIGGLGQPAQQALTQPPTLAALQQLVGWFGGGPSSGTKCPSPAPSTSSRSPNLLQTNGI